MTIQADEFFGKDLKVYDTKMTYQITKQIRILNIKDDWDFVFKTVDDGIVEVQSHEGLEALHGRNTSIYIPKHCIQHFIDALAQFK